MLSAGSGLANPSTQNIRTKLFKKKTIRKRRNHIGPCGTACIRRYTKSHLWGEEGTILGRAAQHASGVTRRAIYGEKKKPHWAVRYSMHQALHGEPSMGRRRSHIVPCSAACIRRYTESHLRRKEGTMLTHAAHQASVVTRRADETNETTLNYTALMHPGRYTLSHMCTECGAH